MKPVKLALSALALTLLATPAIAQENEDHAGHAMMDHAEMDHSEMDHSKMDHSDHADAMAPADDAVAPTASGDTVTAKVNGLVCDFCAQSIRKVFGKQDAVESVWVDLDHGEVVLGLKKGMDLDDETIGKLIRKSGYALVGIERDGDA